MIKFIDDQKLDALIKSKLIIINRNDSPKTKFKTNLIKFNSKDQKNQKQFKLSNKLNPMKMLNKNNQIVILNMPIQRNLMNDQMQELINNPSFIQKSQKSTKNPDQGYKSHHQIFSNSIIKKLQSTQLNKENNHFHFNGIQDESQFFTLKRYNSMEIRVGTSASKRLKVGYDYFQDNQNVLVGESKQKFTSLTHNFHEFKPSFKQHLFKSAVNFDLKLKKSVKKPNFNQLRAISTASGYKRASFQKILETFNKQKQTVNPEIQKLNLEKCSQHILETANSRKKAETAYRSWRKVTSPQKKNVTEQQKQLHCRPWSARKKNAMNIKNAQEENPFNFYSINERDC